MSTASFSRLLVPTLLALSFVATPLSAIPLTGANGKSVEFPFVDSATPKGLVVRMSADAQAIGLTWDKLDLAALERDHPEIYAIHLRAKAGETVPLNLGPSAKGDPASPSSPDKPVEPRYPGWTELKIGKTEYMLQAPATKPRGILLISQDDFGDAFRYIQNHQRGSGYWGVFQTKFDMALLSYNTADYSSGASQDPTKIDDFVFPEKGSGKALFSALAAFEKKLNLPGLADLPIAIYGTDRMGAAFAYNLAQRHPERILAVSLYDGGFYDAEPTEASAKVPILFMWGQYSNRPELWGTENSTLPVLAKAAPLKPLWTSAREFRGRGTMSDVVEHFAKQYLIAMVEARMPKAEPPVEKTETEPPADGAAKEEAPAPEPAGPPVLTEINRAEGSIGNVETGEAIKIKDSDAVLGEGETYLPNATVIRYWKDFVLGTLEAPPRTQMQ